jgi:3-oxoacyl-[acyl-carrier protein] reductase
VHVIINGRDANRLAAAEAQLKKAGTGSVRGVAADVSTHEGRLALLAACPALDILVNNNAGPNPGAFLDFTTDDWLIALEANMVAPLQLVKHVLPAMRERHFGRIVNITSAMVTTPRPHMTLSAGARAGLTAAMKGLSLEVARDNVTINNLLPERFDTARQEQMAQLAMKRDSIDYTEARARQIESIAARRLGKPVEFGAVCAFLCSDLAGFLSGQNIHLDGGSYPGLI